MEDTEGKGTTPKQPDNIDNKQLDVSLKEEGKKDSPDVVNVDKNI